MHDDEHELERHLLDEDGQGGDGSTSDDDNEVRAKEEGGRKQFGMPEEFKLVAHSATKKDELQLLSELLGISVEELQQLSAQQVRALAGRLGKSAGRGM